jgi:K+-transporting ATPase KdpF subunit
LRSSCSWRCSASSSYVIASERPMTLISLILSVAAFVYLVYAMLRPEKF